MIKSRVARVPGEVLRLMVSLLASAVRSGADGRGVQSLIAHFDVSAGSGSLPGLATLELSAGQAPPPYSRRMKVCLVSDTLNFKALR